MSGSTLPSSETEKGQEWTVTVTPNDGTADGPSVSQTVIIGNTAPSDLVVAITPNSSVYNDSNLTCSATANDVDPSDVLEYSYEWSTGETTETITLDSSFNPMDNILVQSPHLMEQIPSLLQQMSPLKIENLY